MKKLTILIVSFALLMFFFSYLPSNINISASSVIAQVLTGEQQLMLENDYIKFYANPENGNFNIVDKKNNTTWHSNPENAKDDLIAKNIFRTNLQSQIFIEYIDDRSLIATTNSYVGSVMESGLTIQKSGEKVLFNYYFPNEDLNVPLFFEITDNKLVAFIDYENVRENGDCKLTKIGLLPYFGAGAPDEQGYMLLPDGSGAIVNFNNDKHSQGNFILDIYGTDKSVVSQERPVETKLCALPVFGIGKPSQGALTAVAVKGEAGGNIISMVGGKETSYNNTYFQFSFRHYNTTTLLDRTWAAKQIIMNSSNIASKQGVKVEYSFSTENGVYGFANRYREYIGKQKQDIVNSALFLDVYMGIKVKKNFLGFSYSAIEPLTTYTQLDNILSQLKDQGVKDFQVRLLGATQSGAYYGAIDDSLSFSSQTGGKDGYKKVVKKFGDVFYPSVELVQFAKNKFSYNSFLHSSSGVINKTIKLYDYKLSTNLRDYDLPLRYLLQPQKVEKAANALQENMKKQDFNCVSPDSLSHDLYSNYSGSHNEINNTKDMFTNTLKKLSKQSTLMMQNPNAYAIAYANSVTGLPIFCSNHYMEDASVPFMQLILDGTCTYATQPINLFSNTQSPLLAAIESNSALNFSIMDAEYEKAESIPIEGLYSSTFGFWEKDISQLYSQLMQVREKTQHSQISGYKVITNDVRQIEFANGAVVYVNHGTTNYENNDLKIGANDFVVS